MKAVYPDSDGNAITRDIYRGLRIRGFTREVEAARILQTEIEKKVFDGLSEIRRKFEHEEYLELLRDFLPLYKGMLHVYKPLESLIDQFERDPDHATEDARQILQMVMDELDDHGRAYRFSTPLNLLIALDALFRLTVLRDRCWLETELVFEKVLECHPILVPEEFTEPLWIEPQDEKSFVTLLRLVIERWNLAELVEMGRQQSLGFLASFEGPAPQQVAQLEALKLLRPMALELLVA